MKRILTLTLILCLLLSGCTIRITTNGQKYTKLTEGSKSPESFTSLVIEADWAEVTIAYGDGWRVDYALPVTPEISLENGTLTIRDLTKNELTRNVTPFIRVTVPQLTELESVEIHLDMGIVQAKDLAITAALTVEIDFGDVELENMQPVRLAVEVNTGKVDLERFTAQNTSITVDTGDIEAELLGDAELYTLELKTDVGDVEVADRNQGNQYAAGTGERRFTARTDVGDIEVEFIGKVSPQA